MLEDLSPTSRMVAALCLALIFIAIALLFLLGGTRKPELVRKPDLIEYTTYQRTLSTGTIAQKQSWKLGKEISRQIQIERVSSRDDDPNNPYLLLQFFLKRSDEPIRLKVVPGTNRTETLNLNRVINKNLDQFFSFMVFDEELRKKVQGHSFNPDECFTVWGREIDEQQVSVLGSVAKVKGATAATIVLDKIEWGC